MNCIKIYSIEPNLTLENVTIWYVKYAPRQVLELKFKKSYSIQASPEIRPLNVTKGKPTFSSLLI